MIVKKTLLALWLSMGFLSLFAQPFFNLDVSIPVSENGNTLRNAWVGGHNNCQFSTIDIDLNGVEDLLVFDKTGNKATTYLNRGTANNVDYEYAPGYRSYFSFIHDWVLLRDYDCDGKKDIFTYSNGTMAIYKNTSDPSYGLQFTLMVDELESLYDTNIITLFILPVDIPTIVDVDKDGDLDILTFDVGGIFMELHKNMSMEKYGTCDSLDFELTEECWGHFEEDANSFLVTLGVSCKRDAVYTPPPSDFALNTRHSGSCSVGFDNDGDDDIDLLVGDIAFKNMNLLTNGGTTAVADITSQDINYPSYDTPIDEHVFPCAYYEDMNNDGKRDLIVSPSRPNISENANSIWYYKNNGTDSSPVFEFQQENLLQDDMIELGEGAYPSCYDVDNDGLTDLLVGNYGYFNSNGTYPSKVAYYRNNGSASAPSFELITDDFTNLSSTGIRAITPTFGDIDDDGVDEMIVGDFDGRLHLYENSASQGQPANFSLQAPAYQSIDVGANAIPQLFDVDDDGLLDLIIGEKNGNLNYYRNTGNAGIPSFTLITDDFGGVDVRVQGSTLGYSAPHMFKYNGELRLIVGSESGNIFFYENIDNNLAGEFTLVSNNYLNIDEGIRTVITGADVDNDGYYDLVIGNYAGGVTFFKGDSVFNPPIGMVEAQENLELNIYPNPTNSLLTVEYNTNNLNIEIYNLAGSSVFSKQITATEKTQIDISKLAEGFYILRASDGTSLISKKFVIAR